MIMYSIGLLVSSLVILLLNIFVFDIGISFGYCLIRLLLTMLIMLAIDSAIALVIRWLLPEKWFRAESKWSYVSKWEHNLYEHLHIKKWKDYVLELGVFTNFSKRKIAKPKDIDYINKFMLESNFGVAIHIGCILFGLIILVAMPTQYKLNITLPVYIINVVFNLMPLMVLRYNLYRLNKLKEILIKKINPNY